MIKLRGLPASPGIAVGRAIIYHRENAFCSHGKTINEHEEVFRFFKALEKTKSQVMELKEETEKNVGKEEAAIFDAHLMILEDEEFTDRIVKLIREKSLRAEEAVKEVSENIIKVFESMESEYFRSRADDVKDLSRRIVENLIGENSRTFELDSPGIVIALELYPSDVVKMKNQRVMGLATEKGSITCHAAIIARAMKIPAVVSVKGLLQNLKNGDLVLVDGTRGIVLINPNEEIIKNYVEKS